MGRLATSSVDDPDIPVLDMELHTRIAIASGNRVLACLVFALHRPSERARRLSTLTPELGRESHRQHMHIVDAIRTHDPAAAQDAMMQHLAYLDEHLKPPPGPASSRRVVERTSSA
jgi:DNA-binding FadR family transcriptional regulator